MQIVFMPFWRTHGSTLGWVLKWIVLILQYFSMIKQGHWRLLQKINWQKVFLKDWKMEGLSSF
ncbi:hypothetical protein BFF94_001025 [Burkholderia catarinensis]|nr:hypothetical protein BFF94_001025 [Burkholderia catarinensis]